MADSFIDSSAQTHADTHNHGAAMVGTLCVCVCVSRYNCLTVSSLMTILTQTLYLKMKGGGRSVEAVNCSLGNELDRLGSSRLLGSGPWDAGNE